MSVDFDDLLRELASAPPVIAPPTAAELPVEIGTYRLLAILGRGASGVVYRAHDRRLDRLVALKVWRRGGERGEEAFLHEARSAALIAHPNIAAVYEVGEARGLPFIAMELADGESLEARIGKATRDEAWSVARSIADALAAAHDHGVVHRDLKPSNVRFTRQGRLKVLDLGLAAKPGTTGFAGTPAYMAPEQARGEAADPRSDVYSLGVVIHELLTGDLPRGALKIAGPDRAILARLLAEHPVDRPRDGRAALELLSSRLTRRRVVPALLGALLLAMAGIAAATHGPGPLVETRLSAFDGSNVQDIAMSPDGSRVAVVSDGTLSLFGVDGSRERVAIADVECARWLGREALLVTDQRAHVSRVDVSRGTSTSLDLVTKRCAIPSRDGREIAYVDEGRHLVTRAIDGGPSYVVLDDIGDAAHFSWSPDGARIAYDHPLATPEQWAIDVVDLDGGTQRIVAGPQILLSTGWASFEWRDADTLVYATSPAPWRDEPGQLLAYDLEDENATVIADLGRAAVWQMSIEQGRIALVRDETNSDVIALSLTSHRTRRVIADEASQYPLAWRDDRLVVADDAQRLFTWARDGSRATPIAEGRFIASASAPLGSSSLLAIERTDEGATLAAYHGHVRSEIASIATRHARSFRDMRDVQVRCAARAQRCVIVETSGASLRVRDVLFDHDRPVGVSRSSFDVTGARQARSTALTVDAFYASEGPRIDRFAMDGEKLGELLLPEECGVQHLAAGGETVYATAGCRAEHPYRLYGSVEGAMKPIEVDAAGWLTHPTPSPDGAEVMLAVTKFASNVLWAELP